MNTLDFEKGGEIAKDLDRLYDFMLFYLTEANLHRDAQRIEKVIGLLDIIYGAYKEIIEGKQDAERDEALSERPELAEAVKRVQISL